MSIQIPDEAVEAALKAWGVGPHGHSRAIVELILEAAAPHMQQPKRPTTVRLAHLEGAIPFAYIDPLDKPAP